jgi:hypothetical protein
MAPPVVKFERQVHLDASRPALRASGGTTKMRMSITKNERNARGNAGKLYVAALMCV